MGCSWELLARCYVFLWVKNDEVRIFKGFELSEFNEHIKVGEESPWKTIFLQGRPVAKSYYKTNGNVLYWLFDTYAYKQLSKIHK